MKLNLLKLLTLCLSLFFLPLMAQATTINGKVKALMSYEKATFAGGCFWCMESPFEKENGVIEAVAGYTGGQTANPTYHEVGSGQTGHMEAVQITFDPSKISYGKLLEIFWRQIDPTDAGGQFADRGTQYQTAIFYASPEQKELAIESKKQLEASKIFDKPIATQILPFQKFWPAEEYHQNYYKTNEAHYKLYKKGSGREDFIKSKWKKDHE